MSSVSWTVVTTPGARSGSWCGSSGGPAPCGRSAARVNQHLRAAPEPHAEDYVFVGYELDDALEAANVTLEDDVVVSEGDGWTARSSRSGARSCSSRSSGSFFGR